MYTQQEAEGKRLKNPFDTITEGIGINRLTANFSAAAIDGAFRGSDREAVEMAQFLVGGGGWAGRLGAARAGARSAGACTAGAPARQLLGTPAAPHRGFV
jgi:cysteine synthase A